MRDSPENNRSSKRQRYESNYSLQQNQLNQPPQSFTNPSYQQQANDDNVFQPLNSFNNGTNITNPIISTSSTLNHQLQPTPQQHSTNPSNQSPSSNSSLPLPSTTLPNSTDNNNSNPSFDRFFTSLPPVGTIDTPNSISNQPLSVSNPLSNWNNPLASSFQSSPAINHNELPPLVRTSLHDSDNLRLPLPNPQPPPLSSNPLPSFPYLFPEVMPSDSNSMPPGSNPPFPRPPAPLRDSSNSRLPPPTRSQLPHTTATNNNISHHRISHQSRSISRSRQLHSIKSPRNRAPSLQQRANSHHNSASPNQANPFIRGQRNAHNSSRDGGLSLGQITPIKLALNEIPDEHAVMKALTQLFMQKSNINFGVRLRRDKVFSFKGFPMRMDPKSSFLSNLGKSDLDIVAWIFNVPSYGRKDEIAKRVISSLVAPLSQRSTSSSRKPKFPRIDRTLATPPPSGINNSSSYNHPGPSSLSNHRGNMPTLMSDQSSIMTPGRTGLLRNLQRQITVPPAPKTISTNRAQRINQIQRATTPMNRSRQLLDMLVQRLNGYNFKEPENPFNIPANAPLGSPPFVAFTSMELSRGENNPVLKFHTPAPMNVMEKPETRDGDVQIHLRCLFMDEKKEKSHWKQSWPFPATCRVNSHVVTLNQAQRYTNGKLAGRDAATDITPFLRKFRTKGRHEENRVSLRRQDSNANPSSGNFILFAQEVIVLSHETMVKNICKESEKHWEMHRESSVRKGLISTAASKFEMAQMGVMQFLSSQEDIAVESMKVSLRCPLALTRIKRPVKGKRCLHVQCFDLDNFLQFARRSSKFECPVCNKLTAYPSMLVVSPYIEHALEHFPNCDEVEIFGDGSMKEVEKKQNGVASDGEDEDGEEDPLPTNSGSGKVPNPTEVVDLTLDSDDEGPGLATMSNPRGFRRAGMSIRSPGMSMARSLHSRMGNEDLPYSRIQAVDREGEIGVHQDDEFPNRGDFTWKYDTNPVGDEELRLQRNTNNSNRDNIWSCDVIAIDSD